MARAPPGSAGQVGEWENAGGEGGWEELSCLGLCRGRLERTGVTGWRYGGVRLVLIALFLRERSAGFAGLCLCREQRVSMATSAPSAPSASSYAGSEDGRGGDRQPTKHKKWRRVGGTLPRRSPRSQRR